MKYIDIYIIGGNFIGKGAEAMMLVTKQQIHKRIPNARFWIQPVNPENEEKYKEIGFNIVYTQKRNRLARRLLLLNDILFSFLNRRKKNIVSGDKVINILRATDAVVDIAGFASSDQFGSNSGRGRWLYYLIANISRNKIIFLPQSWGPFNFKKNRSSTRKMLGMADLIYARERISSNYLIDSGCVDESKVYLSKDIAFLFEVENYEEAAGKVLRQLDFENQESNFITITPNMQIYRRTKGENENNEYIQNISGVINYFLNNTDLNIVLIPHEASFNRKNDMELCILLKELTNNSNRIGILNEDESAANVKAVIGKSDFLVASRYHSLVAALSMRTPVGVIGWSHKYDELMQDIGLSDYIIEVKSNDSSESVLETIKRTYSDRDIIKTKIEEAMPQIEKGINEVFDKTAELLKGEY